MKWEADQAIGFFGYSPRTKDMPAQPRHKKTVDIGEALADAADALSLWGSTLAFPEAPPLSGGILDWPKTVRQGLEICRSEDAVVTAYLRAEEAFRG